MCHAQQLTLMVIHYHQFQLIYKFDEREVEVFCAKNYIYILVLKGLFTLSLGPKDKASQ